MSSPRLLVFADSLAFHGPSGPRSADDQRLWPNVAARALGGRADLVAGFGWTAREAYWSLTGDPRVWALLPSVDVLVLAVGSMDTLPSPLPSYLRQGLRYLRPDPLRRWARHGYLAAQPVLARVTGGRPVALPATLTVRYLDKLLDAVRTLRPDLPAIGVVPSVHRAPSYGYVHTGHPAAVAAVRAWSSRTRVPLLDLPSLVGEHLTAGLGSTDGMHWGWSAHTAVGEACAALVRATGGFAGDLTPCGS